MIDRNTPPFARPIAVRAIPAAGLDDDIAATQAEREAIARWLGLEALQELTFSFGLAPEGPGRLRLTGTLRARLTQACVITLEPLERAVTMAIESRFWPAEDLATPGAAGAALDLDPEDDPPEPFADGLIDLGQFVYEYLAADLDPYPRKPGATFDPSRVEGMGAETPESGPFAALKRLKSS